MIATDLVGLDDFAPVVVAAVTTDRVRPLRLVALRALDELHALQRQVGAALTLAGMRIAGLWESHEQPIISGPRAGARLPAADDLDFFGGPDRRRAECLDALLDGGDGPEQLALE
jgi:hypothetical protein